MPETRIKLAENARTELFARYRTRAEAEVQLVVYLRGIVDALGIPIEAITGFDDVAGELILADGTPPPKRRR